MNSDRGKNSRKEWINLKNSRFIMKVILSFVSFKNLKIITESLHQKQKYSQMFIILTVEDISKSSKRFMETKCNNWYPPIFSLCGRHHWLSLNFRPLYPITINWFMIPQNCSRKIKTLKSLLRLISKNQQTDSNCFQIQKVKPLIKKREKTPSILISTVIILWRI